MGHPFDSVVPALEELCRAHSVAALYLFGSQARGTARSGSDVDVAVLFEKPPQRTIDAYPAELIDSLAEVFGPRVDVVTLNHASPDLVHRVMRDGVLLVERNRPVRVGFETRLRSEYFDLFPILARYRSAVARFLRTA